ncbi:TonB-dependent receptor plug domain-containing protein [Pseudoblastomonas halimionae]|uniref:TonB-dependent receptor n=1 Tax=Alteriqipengyuania halimionae TaxID=1926630 RepID=A0A6I4TZM7_9SPHN|nr:TonB-dependent receptor [Alteriqipengyuania halimionae]MXP08946.1 TonB-dependent receptor [Alteriqipengyuania halimionae]
MKNKLLITSCTGALALAMLPSAAIAQDAGPEEDPVTAPATADQQAEPEDNVITVTGSRIRRSNATAAIPLQIFDRATIDESGTVDLAEIVAEIPGVDSDISPETSNTSVQNSGISTINLRRLGSNRTLTLIDGRRAISNAGNGERVSLNTIPAGFVQSIEVTTGGASAIYGSDAIAGVVNIILKDDFDGFDANLRYAKPERSGEQEFLVDLAWGRNFDEGRGNIMVGFSYEHEDPIYADATRPDSIRAVSWGKPSDIGGFNDETLIPGCEDPDSYCLTPSLSSYLPGGRFESDDAWNIGGVWYNDKSLLPDDGRTSSESFESNVDGYNYRPGQTLSPEYEMLSSALQLRYDLTPGITFDAGVMYTFINTVARSSSESAIYGDTYAVLDANGNAQYDANNNLIEAELPQIASNHPFIPPEVEETRSGSVSWYRRFIELGWDIKDNDRETVRTNFALSGDAWGDWQWNVGGTFGTYNQHQRDKNEIDLQRLANALEVTTIGGKVVCASEAARAEGCVPINIFGEGSITDAMANYIRYDANLRQKREQTTGLASANGTLFELPAGPLKAAAGVEYRHEYQRTWGQGGDKILQTTSTGVPDIEASFDVVEAFAELDIPIFESLSLQLAGRIADYSTVGTVYSYNAGGSFFPSPDIRFRAQYSRSQRAPTLTEFFSPPRGDYDSLEDPCNGLLSDGTGITPPPGSDASATTIAANCLAEPGVQAYFADPDNAGQPFDTGGSVYGPNAGNTNLQEETADTFTAGVILTPRFIPGLALIVDYYDIRVKDAIGSVSTQLATELCYTAENFPNNRFCDTITRNPATGAVREVINQAENLDQYKTSGIDATLAYDWEIGGIPGDFDLNVIYSHYLEDSYTFQAIDGLQTEDTLGLIGNPQDEFRAKIGWGHEGFRFTWTTLFKSGGVDDRDVGPDEPAYFSIGSQAYHNIYASYTLRRRPTVRLYAGVSNLFDDLGPFLPSGLDNGGSRNITTSLNDLDGREFYLGARIVF